MKYVSYIFEDQDVRNTASKNEYLVEVASNAVINHNALLDAYVYNNLERFTGNNLSEIYENIRSFIIQENLAIYSQYSEILSDNQLSDREKVACFESDVAAAVGKFAKKALDGIKNASSNFKIGVRDGDQLNLLNRSMAYYKPDYDKFVDNVKETADLAKTLSNNLKHNATNEKIEADIYNRALGDETGPNREGFITHVVSRDLKNKIENREDPISSTKSYKFGKHFGKHADKYDAGTTLAVAGLSASPLFNNRNANEEGN